MDSEGCSEFAIGAESIIQRAIAVVADYPEVVIRPIEDLAGKQDFAVILKCDTVSEFNVVSYGCGDNAGAPEIAIQRTIGVVTSQQEIIDSTITDIPGNQHFSVWLTCNTINKLLAGEDIRCNHAVADDKRWRVVDVCGH